MCHSTVPIPKPLRCPMSMSIRRALARAKELKGLISTLDERLKSCVSWEEGVEPAFTFSEVVAEREVAVAELITLRAAIARANATTVIHSREREMDLAEVVIHLTELRSSLTLYKSLELKRGPVRSARGYDGAREVITYRSAITEPERAATLLRLQAEFTELNELAEEANHHTQVA